MAQQKTMFDDWGKRELVQPDASRLEREAAAKEDVLDLLEGTRKSLIDAGREIAMSIWRRHGRVTSTDVLEELRSSPFADTLDDVDPRFMARYFDLAGHGLGMTRQAAIADLLACGRDNRRVSWLS